MPSPSSGAYPAGFRPGAASPYGAPSGALGGNPSFGASPFGASPFSGGNPLGGFFNTSIPGQFGAGGNPFGGGGPVSGTGDTIPKQPLPPSGLGFSGDAPLPPPNLGQGATNGMPTGIPQSSSMPLNTTPITGPPQPAMPQTGGMGADGSMMQAPPPPEALLNAIGGSPTSGVPITNTTGTNSQQAPIMQRQFSESPWAGNFGGGGG